MNEHDKSYARERRDAADGRATGRRGSDVARPAHRGGRRFGSAPSATTSRRGCCRRRRGPGPHSAYSPGHLRRLRLIQRLKERYLPLKEIRRRLAGLEDDEVQSLLEADADTAPAVDVENMLWEPSLADARSYLEMLDEREPYRTEPLPFQGPTAAAPPAAPAPPRRRRRPVSPAAGRRARRGCSRRAARRRTRCPISVRSCGDASPWAKKWSSSSPSVSTRVTGNGSTGSCAGRARSSTDATAWTVRPARATGPSIFHPARAYPAGKE